MLHDLFSGKKEQRTEVVPLSNDRSWMTIVRATARYIILRYHIITSHITDSMQDVVEVVTPKEDTEYEPSPEASAIKTPAQTRLSRAVSRSKRQKSSSPTKIFKGKCPVDSAPDTAGTSTSKDPGIALQRVPREAMLEREFARAQRRIIARDREAHALRKRVQELEPEVRKLQKEVEKRRTERCTLLLSPPRCRCGRPGNQQGGTNSNSPQREPSAREDDSALRARVDAAEKHAKMLQLRCDQLELEKSLTSAPAEQEQHREGVGPSGDYFAMGKSSGDKKRNDAKPSIDYGGQDAREEKAGTTRIKRQLEVAERRVQNSLYINEAHESLAARATEREREASARAAEFERRLIRALEKLESIERRDTIAGLRASCVRNEEGIHNAERELRAHQLDPELYLPVNTARRRQLERLHQRLRRLRLRHASQSAALCQVEGIEKLHSDLRIAAGSGDVATTVKLLEAADGLSVNVPDETGLSAFLYACGQANAELVKVLLEVGGDALAGDGSITGLVIAARKVNGLWMPSTCQVSRDHTRVFTYYYWTLQEPMSCQNAFLVNDM